MIASELFTVARDRREDCPSKGFDIDLETCRRRLDHEDLQCRKIHVPFLIADYIKYFPRNHHH